MSLGGYKYDVIEVLSVVVTVVMGVVVVDDGIGLVKVVWEVPVACT